MGQKLQKFYEIVKAEGGEEAAMRLAMKTCIHPAIAGLKPDSPENIQKFKDAFKEITGKDAPID